MSVNRRNTLLNYGKQTLEQDDIDSVLEVLNTNTYLTTGPWVNKFEEKLCKYTGMKYAIAVSNGTAALHCATFAAGINKGDEVIVTTLSFVASANCIVYQNAIPVFVDINPDTMNINVDKIESAITGKTKAIIVVDFAGQLCDYERIKNIADKYNLIVIEDAAHSVGITNPNDADLVTYSFHPVKNMTTGEGGAILTNNYEFAKKLKSFRSHGINNDYKSRYLHYYSMTDIGFNYRLTDIQAALGISQLNKLKNWINIRNDIARKYDNKLKELYDYLEPIAKIRDSGYHIYIIKLKNLDRDTVYKMLREENIGVNVHYKPIHLQPFYLDNYNTFEGQYPISEEIYKNIITLPIFPTMNDKDVDYVVNAIKLVVYKLKN